MGHQARPLGAGAAAIYVGLTGFSRGGPRSELTSLTLQDVLVAAHAQGRHVQVALTTIPRPAERRDLAEKVWELLWWGIDGVIVNDVGLLAELRSRHPTLGPTASIGSAVMNEADVAFYREIGVCQVVADTTLTLRDLLSRKAQLDVGIEILIHANACLTCLGKCWMSPYYRLERTIDEAGKDLFEGSPNRGGIDYRVCLEAWQFYGGDIKREDCVALRNEAFFLLEDIPYLIDLGVRCPKIRGREYTTSLAGNIVRFYRELLDAYAANTPGGPFDLNPWKMRVAVIQAEWDRQRHAGTLALLVEAKLPVRAKHV